MPDKPSTQKETIDAIWYALNGTNGSKGLVQRVEKLENRPRSRWLMVKDILLVLMPILFLLLGKGILNI